MKKIAKICAFFLVLYIGWGLVYPSGSFRYKLTLVVDDNGKRIVASSVREVHAQVNPRILPDVTSHVTVRGEALVADLGEKGILFALLNKEGSDDYGYNMAFNTLLPGGGAATAERVRTYSSLEGKKLLSLEELPMFVRFRDINDPKTVEKVEPSDLEAIFGKGVQLVGAEISITDDVITMGKVKEKLPWFDEWSRRGGTITGQYIFNNPVPSEYYLIPMNFVQR